VPRISPFNKYAIRYEEWFEKNHWVYEAELRAVKAMIPTGSRGLEVGVGTGLFAGPLGIKNGVEPSKHMGEIARPLRECGICRVNASMDTLLLLMK
jgi:hypothetical protein